MFPVLFRNITNTGALVSCGICIALSYVYLELEEEEKERKLKEQLDKEEKENILRRIYQNNLNQDQKQNQIDFSIGPANKRF